MFKFNSTHLLRTKLFEAHGCEEQVGEFSHISPIVKVRDDQNNRKVLFVISLVKASAGDPKITLKSDDWILNLSRRVLEIKASRSLSSICIEL
jgi:hypothetical protein